MTPLEVWKDDVSRKLEKMIDDWERRIPPEEDDTFYTLALRRALDVVQTGEVPPLGP